MDLKNSGGIQDRGADGTFQPGLSANPNGRPKGSKNKATKLREELLGPILPEAITKLHEAVTAGEKWAIELTISYSMPKPKPIDTEEMAEFDERLAELEMVASKH
jgi:hypothetical protein